jgi:hypothetical protein
MGHKFRSHPRTSLDQSVEYEAVCYRLDAAAIMPWLQAESSVLCKHCSNKK